ncbi:MAG TPA: UDP-N-acetylmuramate--L-alanine ligase [Nocardioides sp.]|uniref:UDP-N-acetylmuramate--L-alanine ligase n=1 Tax=Nocardioides sp. TaxID=35761 RepID=UPI002E3382E7|nr:UDP-N-acetylmuramate--L-alanine ligase [Nocardioides sp.]HEX5089900.1 UDP-N-acetylmuramate--L-alanine ligase [Nocardioides sp.]
MKLAVPDELLPAHRLGHVHFVGIGGAGLSAIARIMLARGIRVSGSDGVESPTLDALRSLGARVHVGHAADHLGDADTVVVSTAVREDNPEYTAALARDLRVLPRSAALASVMAGRRVVAVAGTHGKTTTTALLTAALDAAGAEPTYAIGADLAATGSNAAEGTGELFVAEADESDGAFLHYAPYAAVVTNVEADHLDHWGTEEAYAQAFDDFALTIDTEGFLVCCVDDPGAEALAERQAKAGLRVVTVSTRDGAADVGPDALAGTELWSPGDHYLADALMALAAGRALGYPDADLLRGIGSFSGTRRRMERKGEAGGIRVYDSYAHHPTEIDGDLAAARALAGEGRLVVAFQPHLVSRTRAFGPAMGAALGAADEVVVTGVYLAREDADPDVTGAEVADGVPLPAERVAFVPELDDVPAALVARAHPGDLVLTLGAGSITDVGPRVLELLDGADA